ncbi:MAG: hypothetical protein AVO35_09380 [Candidatus Aegiribacteria sp. MLS_C]|nr:MAG: hypothetical protein AVO35_09380 [Candidatus Aegiribacteria sp. MLS_C]
MNHEKLPIPIPAEILNGYFFGERFYMIKAPANVSRLLPNSFAKLTACFLLLRRSQVIAPGILQVGPVLRAARWSKFLKSIDDPFETFP